MLANIEHKGKKYQANLNEPIDISIAVSPNGPRAWYVEPARISPVINQFFRGAVKIGGSVNFNNVSFNPHGHGTHTENVGHIARENYYISESIDQYFFIAELITVLPETNNSTEEWSKPGDKVITLNSIQKALKNKNCEALIVRTQPNVLDKKTKNYSDTNFPYFERGALLWMRNIGILHLLTDLPSVDRESDGGILQAHHEFWNYPLAPRLNATITEFIYVEDKVKDGEYLLNLQVASFRNDAAPSRPVLYRIV
jgi:arylformamidase